MLRFWVELYSVLAKTLEACISHEAGVSLLWGHGVPTSEVVSEGSLKPQCPLTLKQSSRLVVLKNL